MRNTSSWSDDETEHARCTNVWGTVTGLPDAVFETKRRAANGLPHPLPSLGEGQEAAIDYAVAHNGIQNPDNRRPDL